MPNPAHELIVFPTELALRRYQHERALAEGWVDASGHTTFSRLRKCCLPYVKLKGQRMSEARELLMYREVVEVAHGHFAGQGTLGELSSSALEEVLELLLRELASLPFEAARIVEWMLDQPRNRKLYQLGTLYSVWRAILKQEGLADALDVNLAILRLLRGGRQHWPPLLRNAGRLTFRSVRWFNPFEEQLVAALNRQMRVTAESALPDAHAEASADRLGQRVRAEIMAQPWTVWAEELGDALAVDSPELLQLDAADRIEFSRSSGAYGEIEDLARRICRHLESTNIEPGRIALVVPNIGTVQDIIPHVFSRFQVPYYFRRGRPVLSSPCVKAFLAWLAFPLHPERDVLIDLVRNPAIRFGLREETVAKLRDHAPRLKEISAYGFHDAAQVSGTAATTLLREWMVEPDDHFNAEALRTVESALEGFGARNLPLRVLVDLIEQLLENATVRPRDSHEQGVWIINPHDAVGLDFDLVLFAGLNEGEFPSIPQQDALLNDDERYHLKKYLEEQGIHLPAMALPKADIRFEQQAVQFLCVLGMARKQLVLSYQSTDAEGNEKAESEYYRKLWNLAGWCVRQEIVPGAYDLWRMQQTGDGNHFLQHLALQQGLKPEDRLPMPGESFLTIIPLPLCRATDEALQAAIQQSRRDACDTYAVPQASRLPSIEHLVTVLKIEAERDAYLESPVDSRSPSAYCGHISAFKEHIDQWFSAKGELSPTALETLAQSRYVFLMEHVLGLSPERKADDMPDPLDRGGLVHGILREIYSRIASGDSGIDAPRSWAIQSSTGWRRRTDDSEGAVPLAVFDPAHENEYVEFARITATRMLAAAEAAGRKLGHMGVWAAEREKVMEQILNFVRHDACTCAAENRYPALFEFRFGGDSAVVIDDLRLKGTVDRVDLLFADTGELDRIRVLDYKGASRALGNHEDYLAEIRNNLDCQLPVYALAVQQHFLGESNTEMANGRTEAGYLFYQRDPAEVAKTMKKSLIRMDEPELIDFFLSTLLKNVRRLKDGDFSVDPLIVSYNDYESVCRTTAVDRADLE